MTDQEDQLAAVPRPCCAVWGPAIRRGWNERIVPRSVVETPLLLTLSKPLLAILLLLPHTLVRLDFIESRKLQSSAIEFAFGPMVRRGANFSHL